MRFERPIRDNLKDPLLDLKQNFTTVAQLRGEDKKQEKMLNDLAEETLNLKVQFFLFALERILENFFTVHLTRQLVSRYQYRSNNRVLVVFPNNFGHE